MNTVPSRPATSVTLALRVSLLVSLTPATLQAVDPAVAVATVQVAPLSKDTLTVSPLIRFDDRAPVTVCELVVSARLAEVIVMPGPVVSRT